MRLVPDVGSKVIAAVLATALLVPHVASAKPGPNPETIHRKLVQRGVGTWIGIETKDGLALVGRLTNLDEQSFGMQLENYPEVTTIAYGNVLKLHMGMSHKGLMVFAAVGVGAVAGMAAWGFHHVNELKNNPPAFPQTR